MKEGQQKQSTEQISINTTHNAAAPIFLIPQSILELIMWYATPKNSLVLPNARLVCRRFKEFTDLSGLLQYNQTRTPQFRLEADGKQNLAVEKQQKEINYLLTNEAAVIAKNFPAIIIKECLAKLKESIKIESTSRQFIERELILDRLAMSIIETNIQESQSSNPAKLGCADCFLTRFPGTLITQPKFRDYWAKLERFSLERNQLQSLPAEIGQLAALRLIYLGNNQLKSLPVNIGKLRALQVLMINNNQLQNLPVEIGQLRALEWLVINNNHLQTLPAEIEQLGALKALLINHNQLQSLPAEIERLTSLLYLKINNNKLQSLPENLKTNILRDGENLTTKAQVLASQKPLNASPNEESKSLKMNNP